MSSYSRRQKKRKRAKLNKKQPVLDWWRSLNKRSKGLFTVISGAAFLVGLIASVLGIYSFYVTRISISPGPALDQTDLFSTMFTVSNDGALPLYDVHTECRLNYVKGPNNFSIVGEGTTREEPSWAPKVDPSEKMTVRCWMPVKSETGASVQWRGADINIVVSYRPKFFLWALTREMRFRTQRNSDGLLQWFQQPAS